MSKRPRRTKSKPQVPDHPVIPGSILYRVLQQVANAVAAKLADRGASDRLGNNRPASGKLRGKGGDSR